ncbi:MAG TPA: alpha/beta hydrolase-fold protein [Bacteroidota bacterium]|nr:alpha/beta hydrolase-fold protein [Bacteroidota bacterium]
MQIGLNTVDQMSARPGEGGKPAGRMVTGVRNAVLLLVLIPVTLQSQVVCVRFTVVAPSSTPADAKVCIAGNTHLLGDWNPGVIRLEKKKDLVWSGQFEFESGAQLEYKITRGTWNSQALYERGVIPANSRLVVDRDTEIVIRPVMWSDGLTASAGGITGTVRYHKSLEGEGLRYTRDLIVWLPPSYDKAKSKRYPVLYMHDGQNIIDPATSFIGFDWRIDEVADSLIREGKMQEIIVVGIYNSPDRMIEYSDTSTGRAYANFVVHVVKPFIDSAYRTLPDRNNTAVMGSSLGGLVSFLFAWWYPDVFSKAGCLSSVFTYNRGKILREVEEDTSGRRNLKIYVDCGGFGEEASLKSGMERMVSLLKEKGYKEGTDLESVFYPGAEHSERAWAARLWRPLLFLFGTH